MSDLHADHSAIAAFVKSMFRYADAGTFVSLRAFDQFKRDQPAIFIRPVVLDDLEALIHHATKAAEDCAQYERPVVFAPPICTFTNPDNARGIDLANGLTLSVELDDVDPDSALTRLSGLIGTPTLVVNSGSEWTEAGVNKPKTHIHWRLSEPTRTEDEHYRLRQARTLAALLVGADPTGKPVVHPLRWPGSWNMKNTPRIASIAHHNERAEINLGEALETLEGAIEAAGWDRAEMPKGASSNPEAPLEIVRDAVSYIPNQGVDVHYDEWIRMGYAIHRATGGSEDGFDIFDKWSSLSDKYLAGETEGAWRRISNALRGKNPPRTIGAGTIFYLAGRAGWTRPHPFNERGQTYGDYQDDADQGQDSHDNRSISPLPIIYFEDIHPNLDAADFVEGLLIEASMAVVYGESNCGKTFFMADLAMHIAMARMWRGRQIELGGVIYVALEGSHGISNRVSAFRIHYNLGPLELPFAIIPSSINLLDPNADTDRLILAIRVVAEEKGIIVRLVIVDTLSRSLAGGNENAPDDMGALVTNADKIRQATRAAIVFVHHSGKDTARGARGHSLLRAATDTEIEVSREDEHSPSIARVTKQRELEIEGEFWFRLEQIVLGTNRRGKPVTSCVVIEHEMEGGTNGTSNGTNGTKHKKKLTSNATLGVRALIAAMSRCAAKLPPTGDYPVDTWAVSAAEWRAEFYQLKSGWQDTNKHAFSRAETELLAENIITQRNGFVWWVKRDMEAGQNGIQGDKE